MFICCSFMLVDNQKSIISNNIFWGNIQHIICFLFIFNTLFVLLNSKLSGVYEILSYALLFQKKWNFIICFVISEKIRVHSIQCTLIWCRVFCFHQPIVIICECRDVRPKNGVELLRETADRRIHSNPNTYASCNWLNFIRYNKLVSIFSIIMSHEWNPNEQIFMVWVV